jgi:hypothetical protein
MTARPASTPAQRQIQRRALTRRDAAAAIALATTAVDALETRAPDGAPSERYAVIAPATTAAIRRMVAVAEDQEGLLPEALRRRAVAWGATQRTAVRHVYFSALMSAESPVPLGWFLAEPAVDADPAIWDILAIRATRDTVVAPVAIVAVLRRDPQRARTILAHWSTVSSAYARLLTTLLSQGVLHALVTRDDLGAICRASDPTVRELAPLVAAQIPMAIASTGRPVSRPSTRRSR